MAPDSCRRGSKAQMCLFKILHIIYAFPSGDSPENQRSSHDFVVTDENSGSRGFDVDLNISLRAPPDIEQFESPVEVFVGEDIDLPTNFVKKSSESTVHDTNEVQSVCKSESFAVEESERGIEHSVISYVGDQSSEIDNNRVVSKEEGYLGLLIDAAKLILSDYDASEPVIKPSRKVEPSRKSSGMKRKQCWTAEEEWWPEFEHTSPVVKTKRGRNQVLPCRYRDSVLGPLVRLSRHRSNAVSSSKRGSK